MSDLIPNSEHQRIDALEPLVLEAASAADHWPMVERWLAHFASSDDAVVNGVRVDPRPLFSRLLLHGGPVEFMTLRAGRNVVGCCAHVPVGTYLEGLLLWIEPEHRTRGLLEQHMEAALALAAERGLRGIRFQSKVWGRGLSRLGFRAAATLLDSERTVTTWAKEIEPCRG